MTPTREIHQTAPTSTPTASVAPFPAPAPLPLTLKVSENDERCIDRRLQKKERDSERQSTATTATVSTKHDDPPPPPTAPLSGFSKAAHGNVNAGTIRPSTQSFWSSVASPEHRLFPPPAEYYDSGPKSIDSGVGESLDLLHLRNNHDLHPALQENQPLNAPRLRIRPISSRKETEAAPISIPHLRIKPTTSKKDVKLSSPLARRGAAERAYLQGQLKAEKLRRQKQDHFNEQRKLREVAKSAFAKGARNEDKPDGEVLRLAGEFKLFEGLDAGPSGTNVRKVRSDMREFGISSPPAILVKSTKRSVSDVLNDSGICDDRDILFFPDGVPLPLKDKDENLPEDVTADAESQGSLNERSSSSKGDSNAFEQALVSLESSSADDPSPSTEGACVIEQLGASCCDDPPMPSDLSMLTRKGNKKVTLRPKMNAPKHDVTGLESPLLRKLESIGTCRVLGRLSPGNQLNESGKNEECHQNDTSTSENSQVNFLSPEKAPHFVGDALLAFEPSSLLSSNPTKTIDNLQDDCIDIKQQLFVFSSPDAEFFCTPDGRRPCRKHLCMRMPKLPELGVPEAIINLEAVSEMPDVTAALEEVSIPEMGGLLLKEPLSESNFCTPDHSFNGRAPFCKRLYEAMPTMPNLEGISWSQKSFDALDGMVGGESMVEPDSSPEGQPIVCHTAAEDGKPFLFRTPDNSYTERRPYCRQSSGRMPKLPELGMTCDQSAANELSVPCMNDNEGIVEEERVSYSYNTPKDCRERHPPRLLDLLPAIDVIGGRGA